MSNRKLLNLTLIFTTISCKPINNMIRKINFWVTINGFLHARAENSCFLIEVPRYDYTEGPRYIYIKMLRPTIPVLAHSKKLGDPPNGRYFYVLP